MSTQADFRPRCSPVFPYFNRSNAAAAAKSLQLCPTLCDSIDGSPPGSPVRGILQARTLEWVAISFSSAWKWKVKVKSLSRVRLFVTPWTAAYQAPLSMGFSRQEYWSGVPSPSPSPMLPRCKWYHKMLPSSPSLNPNWILTVSQSFFLWVDLVQTKEDICKFQSNHYVISTSFLVRGGNFFSLGRKKHNRC